MPLPDNTIIGADLTFGENYYNDGWFKRCGCKRKPVTHLQVQWNLTKDLKQGVLFPYCLHSSCQYDAVDDGEHDCLCRRRWLAIRKTGGFHGRTLKRILYEANIQKLLPESCQPGDGNVILAKNHHGVSPVEFNQAFAWRRYSIHQWLCLAR